jgi:hypothetical protein
MSVEQATVFLATSILVMLGMIALVIGVVVINNIIHRHWKPINVFTQDSWAAFNPPMKYDQERQTPTLNKEVP